VTIAKRPTHDELLALTDKAQKGDRSVLPAIRELLKDPVYVDALGGQLAIQVEQALLRKFSGNNLLLQESVTRKLDLMRTELGGPTPTALERLLVDRIVTCWLHLHHLEVVYANKDSMALELGAYYQHSLSAAHKRYLAAIKALAAVRKLAVPVLQVNIARKQVNVAGARPIAETGEKTD
jgi:hypothetical protein